MNFSEVCKEVRNYTPRTVFIPFTLTFFLLFAFKIFDIINPNNINSFYIWTLILSSVFIIVSNYFLTYYGLINASINKRGYRFTVSFLGFLIILIFNLEAIRQISQTKYINNAMLLLLISLLISWLVNQVLHSNFYSKLLNATVVFTAFYYALLQKMFLSTNFMFYRDIRDFVSDTRFLNIFSLILLVSTWVLMIKYINLFFGKSLEITK